MIFDLLWAILGGGYIAGRCLVDKHNMSRTDTWWTTKNYNRKRQDELENMIIFEREKFTELLGHPFDAAGIGSCRQAVAEIMHRESYDYYDLHEDVLEWADKAHVKYRGKR